MEREIAVAEKAPTLEEDMTNRSLNTGGWQYHHTPHFVVRGVFSPETTRCDLTHRIYSKSLAIATEDAGGPELSRLLDYRSYVTCVTNFEAREYMVVRVPKL